MMKWDEDRWWITCVYKLKSEMSGIEVVDDEGDLSDAVNERREG